METSSENEIQFKPLHEGLGFHPFSEGLPYSPSSKAKKTNLHQSGLGAVSAGAPTFARTLPPIASIAAPAELQRPAPVPASAHSKGFGYVFIRTAAYLFDTSVNFVLCSAALGWVLWKQNIQPELFLTPEMGAALLVFIFFFSWALTTAQEIAFGASAGKRLFGLTLPGSAILLLLRSVLFLIGTLFCGFGLLWALFDRDRRCWHDLAVGVQPEFQPSMTPDFQ
ncbi:MAG: hypothetical protein A2Z97_01765 [Bdellovibrionales bacterium GWB1_52_6]|nr:MAG: hypothetical protein A2Z97_01765 [Bdellovibrionales bacterium GWB1_52_6]OFZ04924.1 MAG: hypothetical protein A2X97_16305 [Bdellovibrionales bacterium GWA1_52_35]HCM38860.1 hypothetical protein [Bdellovibrionales bacterium]